MALSSHIDQLKQRHMELEQKLSQAQKTPSVGQDELVEIKRKKLLIKDKLNQLVH
ncbi:MAG: YdcH family protein [Nitratireductor sp.]